MENMKPKTSTERAREYRERLKAEGGKEAFIRLTPDEAKMLGIVRALYFGNTGIKTDSDVLKAVFLRVARKAFNEVNEAKKLKDQNGADEDAVDLYYDLCREHFNVGMPAMDADAFYKSKLKIDALNIYDKE